LTTTEHVYSTGADVAKVVDSIEPILSGFPDQDVIMACISIAICLQHPSISADQLTDAVYGATKWIADYLEFLDTAPAQLPANKVN
jgi:hypothetical protein